MARLLRLTASCPLDSGVSFGLIDAEGFLGHIVAGQPVSSPAAAEANSLEFTESTLALQFVDVAEMLKNLPVLPNVSKRLPRHVSGRHRQVATGEDVAAVRDKANPRPGQTASGHGVHPGVFLTAADGSVRMQFPDRQAGSSGFGSPLAKGPAPEQTQPMCQVTTTLLWGSRAINKESPLPYRTFRRRLWPCRTCRKTCLCRGGLQHTYCKSRFTSRGKIPRPTHR